MASDFLAYEDELAEGQPLLATTESGEEIALFKVNGKIYALKNSCPHAGGPLNDGTLTKTVISCPWHGWQFDVRNGECLTCPGYNAETVPLSIVEGKIFLAGGSAPMPPAKG